jgi:hypothetical protein
MSRLALVLVLVSAPARADRPTHGSFSAGGALLLTGDDGSRQRAELELDVEPASRYGALVAWRGFDQDRHGLVTAGLMYEGAAARPRLVLDLHADVGADLDLHAPALGGGLRTVLTLIGPLALALDTGAYLVIDGVDKSRLQIQSGLGLAARW